MTNKNTTYQNLWDATEVVCLWVYRFKVCIRNEERMNGNKIKVELQNIEKEQ